MAEETINSKTEENQIKSLPNGHLRKDLPHLNNNLLEQHYLRDRLRSLQNVLLKDFKKRIDQEIENVVQELRQHELQQNEFKAFAKPQQSSTWNNRLPATEESNQQRNYVQTDSSEIDAPTAADLKSTNKFPGKHKKQPRALSNKVFVMRESYLTALLEVDHIRTIYHIFATILIVILMHSITYDYLVEGRVLFGLGTFKSGLEKISYVFLIWLIEHIIVFTLYYAFKMWANVRAKLTKQSALQSFWSHSCLIIYISSQLVFGYVASALCLKLELPFITGSILLLESTRLLMKMHAFVRTNAARVLEGKLKTDVNSSEIEETKESQQSTHALRLPTFSTYLYFLFAPTLIYRDSYPRTSHIRWKFVLARFMEVIAVAFTYSYLFECHIKTQFENYGREEFDKRSLIVKLYNMIMPNNIIFLAGFYLILHAWLNFTSELLRFGDRMFYKDWWTSSSYDAFFRNWNVVVHDWLYEYIYKDSYNHLFKGSKWPATLMVFYVSALVHEHILSFAFGFFFPVLFLFFGVFSVIMVFLFRNVPKRIGNFVIWLTLIIGNGVIVSLYSMEHFARVNCQRTDENWTDYLIPSIWSCYNK